MEDQLHLTVPVMMEPMISVLQVTTPASRALLEGLSDALPRSATRCRALRVEVTPVQRACRRSRKTKVSHLVVLAVVSLYEDVP